MNFIDSHAHLSSEKFDEDRAQVIARAFEAGLVWILDVGDSIESSEQTLKHAGEHPNIVCGVGVHPHNAKDFQETEYGILEDLATKDRVVAIGEIGLDYHYDFSPKQKQKEVFISQLRLAKRLSLPVIIHNRESHDDILEILEQESDNGLEGVFHCFSGDKDFAGKILDLGFYLSFSGTLTFRKAETLRDVAAFVPDNRVLTETDCPYLAPQAFRGKRNEPSYVREVTRFLAEIQQKPVEEMAAKIEENFSRLFLKDRTVE